MATATITLTLASPTEGSAWEVEFTADDATAINTITGFSISATTPSLPSLFTVSSVNGYDGSGVQYVTWRSTSPAGQHPSSGLSMDIWNQKFYQNIMDNNMTWTDMLTNGDSGATYNLNSGKYSLIYNYSQLYAPIYSKGGTLTVAVA
jgi:hypothetical protein